MSDEIKMPIDDPKSSFYWLKLMSFCPFSDEVSDGTVVVIFAAILGGIATMTIGELLRMPAWNSFVVGWALFGFTAPIWVARHKARKYRASMLDRSDD